MADLDTLLDSTTPTDVAHLDLGSLASVARGRTARRRAATGAAALSLVAIAGLGLITIASPDADGPQEPSILEQPDDAPLGSWEQLPSYPLGARSNVQAHALSDDRLLFFGGQSQGVGRTIWHTDGAIFDPEARTWEQIDAAPLAEVSFGRVLLGRDRLVVVASGAEAEAAVYDVAEGRWLEVPAIPDRGLPLDLRSYTFDGDTFAAVLTAGAWTRSSLDAVAPGADDPQVEAWRFDIQTRTWSVHAGLPVPPRDFPEYAAMEGKLAFYGGSEPGSDSGPDGIGERSGAIYDVATDTVTVLGDLDFMGDRLELGFLDGTHLGFGVDESRDGQAMRPASWWIYDTATGEMASTGRPEQGWVRPSLGPHGHGPVTLVLARHQESHPPRTFAQPAAIWDVDGGRWVEAVDPGDRSVFPMSSGSWLTSRSEGNPGDGPFTVGYVDRASGAYLGHQEGPFTNLMGAAVVGVGEDLYVLGGLAGRAIESTADLWVFHRLR